MSLYIAASKKFWGAVSVQKEKIPFSLGNYVKARLSISEGKNYISTQASSYTVSEDGSVLCLYRVIDIA